MSWAALPHRVVVHVLQYLPLTDLLKAELVCKEWTQAARSNLLWMDLVVRDFGKSNTGDENIDYRQKYIELHSISCPKITEISTRSDSHNNTAEISEEEKSSGCVEDENTRNREEILFQEVIDEMQRHPITFSHEITSLVVSKGLPTRILGRLRNSTTILRTRSLVLVEMIALSFKEHVNMQLSKSTTDSKQLLVDLLKNIQSEIFYDEILREKINEMFPEGLAQTEKSLYKLVNSPMLFQLSRSVTKYIGLELTFDGHTKLLNSLDSKKDSPSTIPFGTTSLLESDKLTRRYSLRTGEKLVVEDLKATSLNAVLSRFKADSEQLENEFEEDLSTPPPEGGIVHTHYYVPNETQQTDEPNAKLTKDEENKDLDFDSSAEDDWVLVNTKVESTPRSPQEDPESAANKFKWLKKRMSIGAVKLGNRLSILLEDYEPDKLRRLSLN